MGDARNWGSDTDFTAGQKSQKQSCQVRYQQEAMCVSWDESTLLSNEVEKHFHVPTLAKLLKTKGGTGLIRPAEGWRRSWGWSEIQLQSSKWKANDFLEPSPSIKHRQAVVRQCHAAVITVTSLIQYIHNPFCVKTTSWLSSRETVEEWEVLK